MAVQIADWVNFEVVLPIADEFNVGLEFQEFMQPENLDNPGNLVKKIKSGVKNLNLVSMHGPFSELVPASRDPLVRQVAGKRFQQAYEIARLVGAKHLVLHSGFFPKTYPSEKWLENAYAFWMDFLRDKPESGLIHLENAYEDDFTTLRILIDRVDEAVGSEKLTICLDIGHVNANSSRGFNEWIVGLADRIRYVHLHNNGGVLDDHWRLDRGTIDVENVLGLLAKNSPHAQWTVETPVNDIEPSLRWLQARGYLLPP